MDGFRASFLLASAFAIAALLSAALAAQAPHEPDLRALADRAFELFEPVGMAVAVVEDGEVVVEV